MSEILKPPQRRPDMIGQCDSCRTIAIFPQEDQFVRVEEVEVPPEVKERWGDKPDTVIPAYKKTVKSEVANCPACSQHVTLHTLGSDKGIYLKETADGNPMAGENYRKRVVASALEPLERIMNQRFKIPTEPPKTTLRDTICDAWDWFWRRER